MVKSLNLLIISILFSACNLVKTEEIFFGQDHCTQCRMTIVDSRFGGEAITDKGKVFKFDSIECMHEYQKRNSDQKLNMFVLHHEHKGEFIEAQKAIFYINPDLRSPMGKGILASREQSSFNGKKVIQWQELLSELEHSSQ